MATIIDSLLSDSTKTKGKIESPFLRIIDNYCDKLLEIIPKYYQRVTDPKLISKVSDKLNKNKKWRKFTTELLGEDDKSFVNEDDDSFANDCNYYTDVNKKEFIGVYGHFIFHVYLSDGDREIKLSLESSKSEYRKALNEFESDPKHKELLDKKSEDLLKLDPRLGSLPKDQLLRVIKDKCLLDYFGKRKHMPFFAQILMNKLDSALSLSKFNLGSENYQLIDISGDLRLEPRDYESVVWAGSENSHVCLYCENCDCSFILTGKNKSFFYYESLGKCRICETGSSEEKALKRIIFNKGGYLDRFRHEISNIETEYYFDPKNNRTRVDFYILFNNGKKCIIEHQGLQHLNSDGIYDDLKRRLRLMELFPGLILMYTFANKPFKTFKRKVSYLESSDLREIYTSDNSIVLNIDNLIKDFNSNKEEVLINFHKYITVNIK